MQFNANHKLSIKIYNKQAMTNRDTLKRLIDVVCFLGEQELAFRGYGESEESDNLGNYVEVTFV